MDALNDLAMMVPPFNVLVVMKERITLMTISEDDRIEEHHIKSWVSVQTIGRSKKGRRAPVTFGLKNLPRLGIFDERLPCNSM